MKGLLIIGALLLGAAAAHAQDQAPSPAGTLPTVSGTAADVAAPGTLTPGDWLKIGGAFGSRAQWQLGLDKSLTAGSCAAYAVRARFLMAGPCRDVLLLAKDKIPFFHLGGAVLYSASHTPGYLGRLGFNIGPAAAGVLEYTADKLPYLEAVTEWKAPPALAYVGKITTVDYMVGVVGGQFDHGPEVKVDVPLQDLAAALGLGGGK